MKALSFFSGCLGMDLGLEQAGLQSILYCENDPAAAKTISKNRPSIPLISDILNYNAEEILNVAKTDKSQVDLIVGGPPCQAFSTAGKRASFEDPRGNVFLHFISLIEEIKPRYFVIENVRGLLSAALKHRPHSQRGLGHAPLLDEELPGGALNYIIKHLKHCGYEIAFNLYNTANYGVPQKRERLIIIGSLSGRVPYLKPTHSNINAFGLPDWKTFREVTSDLQEASQEFIQFSKKRVKYYEYLKDGQNWKNLPDEIVKEAMGGSYNSGGGKTGFFRRLAWDAPSPTLVTHPAMPATDLCHPNIIRPLSISEYKRIQQFPDDYGLEGTILQKYKQIGNAVPVGFGYSIGKAILEHFERKNTDSILYNDFPFSRYKNTSDLTWGIQNARATAQEELPF